jgi:GDP-4-dehydro-6-deoxy-D-mannose reductase
MPSVRRVFVTGGAGFVGSRLVTALRARGDVVAAPDLAELDVLDVAALRIALERENPDVVVHLAAISHVPTCAADPSLAIRVNLGGTAGLLAAMREAVPRARLVFASTAQVYAAPDRSDVVIDETRAIAPQNLYARTKWDAELLIADAAHREGLRATVLRLFNHTHKSQAPSFFLPHIYRSVADGARRIPVGNVQLARDIGSVQDLTVALLAALDRDAPHEVFNVCSGTSKALGTLATALAARLGAEVELVTVPEKVRPGEPAVIRGSHARFTEATGWSPRAVTETALIDAFLADA